MHYEAGKKIGNKSDSDQYSIVDRITGLYNKTGFITLTEHHIRLAKRNKSKVLMLYAKLDRLTYVLDKFGYQARDMAILETSKLLTSTFRDSDIIARISENAFLIFLIGCKEENADGVFNHFQREYDELNARRNKKYRFPISYCIVDFSPQFNNEFENILAQAEDLLLLQTKTKEDNNTVHC